jgi:hypothetical protein
VLRDLEYQTPAHAAPLFAQLVQRRRAQLGRRELVALDLCCSYGINAALLNHDLTLDALYQRYCSLALASLSTENLAAADRVFYRDRRLPTPVQVIGLDVAQNALAYGQGVGLLTDGSSDNLEAHEPSPALSRVLPRVDLITVTGGVGYISAATFGRVLDGASANEGPWVAAFALRWAKYDRIAETLQRYGLETEKLTSQTFLQRRFANDAERDYVLAELAGMGIDPDGKELEGWYHAEFYLSRPRDQMRSLPLGELLEDVGRARPSGPLDPTPDDEDDEER